MWSPAMRATTTGMKGWNPSPSAIGMATRAMIVEAVIHGTKKWRTKAMSETVSTKP